MYWNRHNSTTQDSPKLETTQTPMNNIKGKGTMYGTMQQYVAMKMSRLNPTNVTLSKSSHSRKTIHYESIYESSRTGKAYLRCRSLDGDCWHWRKISDWEGTEGGCSGGAPGWLSRWSIRLNLRVVDLSPMLGAEIEGGRGRLWGTGNLFLV